MTIMLFLIQDGITNGAIYALLGLALVLVFAVTRVILIPQGEFVTYGALTYASLSAGQMPGTARLAVAMGVVAFCLDLFAGRKALHPRLVGRAFAINIALPAVVFALTSWLAGRHPPIAVNRLGARVVGIRTTLSGQIAFLLASVIGAISGILIVPITTLYYDTGFLIGLKGFIAAIIGGLVSYPLTAVAALMVGTVEAFSSFYASNFKEVIVFTLIIPVLVLGSLAAPAVEEEKD